MEDSTWTDGNNTDGMGHMNATQTKYELKTCEFPLK